MDEDGNKYLPQLQMTISRFDRVLQGRKKATSGGLDEEVLLLTVAHPQPSQPASQPAAMDETSQLPHDPSLDYQSLTRTRHPRLPDRLAAQHTIRLSCHTYLPCSSSYNAIVLVPL